MNSSKGASVTPLIVKSLELSHVSSWKNNLIVYVYTLKVISTSNLLFIYIVYH